MMGVEKTVGFIGVEWRTRPGPGSGRQDQRRGPGQAGARDPVAGLTGPPCGCERSESACLSVRPSGLVRTGK